MAFAAAPLFDPKISPYSTLQSGMDVHGTRELRLQTKIICLPSAQADSRLWETQTSDVDARDSKVWLATKHLWSNFFDTILHRRRRERVDIVNVPVLGIGTYGGGTSRDGIELSSSQKRNRRKFETARAGLVTGRGGNERLNVYDQHMQRKE